MNRRKKLILNYLQVRDITRAEIARLAGIGQHSVYKAIDPQPYKNKNGKICYLPHYEARAAIAAVLCLPYEHLWGPHASNHLKRLIRKTIDYQVAIRAEQDRTILTDRYLKSA